LPTYEYRCKNGHTFEVMQSMADDPVTTCEQCSAAVERVFHPVAVHFKGSGFYSTDYGKKRSGASDDSSKEGAAKGSGSESKDTGSKSEAKDKPKAAEPKSSKSDD
jgi:putative FmdB family regulatory protein